MFYYLFYPLVYLNEKSKVSSKLSYVLDSFVLFIE